MLKPELEPDSIFHDRPGRVNGFETFINIGQMNLNWTLFVLQLSKHRPHSAMPSSNSG